MIRFAKTNAYFAVVSTGMVIEFISEYGTLYTKIVPTKQYAHIIKLSIACLSVDEYMQCLNHPKYVNYL